MVDDQHKTFLVEYRHGGAEWGIQLPALSYEDAKARLSRLAYGTIKGEVVMTLPASTGPLANFVTTVRNALRSLVAPQR